MIPYLNWHPLFLVNPCNEEVDPLQGYMVCVFLFFVLFCLSLVFTVQVLGTHIFATRHFSTKYKKQDESPGAFSNE